jgi:transcriptional regulator with XRE-family HTH domain
LRLPKGYHDERYRRLIDRLVTHRKQAGLSQMEIAKLLGTHQQFVSRYETGERRLDAIELLDVCVALGADWVDVLQVAME